MRNSETHSKLDDKKIATNGTSSSAERPSFTWAHLDTVTSILTLDLTAFSHCQACLYSLAHISTLLCLHSYLASSHVNVEHDDEILPSTLVF